VNCFVVVTTKGAALPDAVIDRLRQAAPSALAYEPDAHHHWIAPDRRVAAAAWELGPGALGVGSRWHDGEGGVTTFSGHPWVRGRSWTGPGTWATQLDADLRRLPLDRDLERFEGIYAIASLDHHGHGTLANDPLGFGALYRGETAEFVVVSTRAAVVAWLTTPPGRRPAPDVEAAASLAFVSYLLENRTGFEGVRVLPQGAHVQIDHRGVRVEQPTATPWLEGGRLPRHDLTELVPVIGAEIRASTRIVTSLTDNGALFELTGGKDSRLVLAHTLADGVADRCVHVTWGGPDLPDVVVAADLAARFHLRRPGDPPPNAPASASAPAARAVGPRPASVREHPPSPHDHFADGFRRHLRATSGASSSWDLRLVATSVAPRPSITGFAGEALRTIHARTAPLRTMDDVARYVRLGGFGTDPAGILTPDARRHLQDVVIGSIAEVAADDGSVQDAIDGFYLSSRLRRWFSTIHEHENRNRTFPLYSLTAIRTAFALGHVRRHAQVLPFELMRAAHPDLARIPFAGDGWPELALAGLPDAADHPRAQAPRPDRPLRRLLEGVEPPTETRRSRLVDETRRLIGRGRPRDGSAAPSGGTRVANTKVEATQIHDADAKIAVLLDGIDVRRNHPLADVIDVRALRAAAGQFGSLGYLGRRAVHDAATAIHWIDEADTSG
jgi:hypothetical protein